MAGIFNVGNTYNKRITSKLSFDTGEKFSGKIIKNRYRFKMCRKLC